MLTTTGTRPKHNTAANRAMRGAVVLRSTSLRPTIQRCNSVVPAAVIAQMPATNRAASTYGGCGAAKYENRTSAPAATTATYTGATSNGAAARAFSCGEDSLAVRDSRSTERNRGQVNATTASAGSSSVGAVTA